MKMGDCFPATDRPKRMTDVDLLHQSTKILPGAEPYPLKSEQPCLLSSAVFVSLLCAGIMAFAAGYEIFVVDKSAVERVCGQLNRRMNSSSKAARQKFWLSIFAIG